MRYESFTFKKVFPEQFLVFTQDFAVNRVHIPLKCLFFYCMYRLQRIPTSLTLRFLPSTYRYLSYKPIEIQVVSLSYTEMVITVPFQK